MSLEKEVASIKAAHARLLERRAALMKELEALDLILY
jgi:hypothetical protein